MQVEQQVLIHAMAIIGTIKYWRLVTACQIYCRYACRILINGQHINQSHI